MNQRGIEQLVAARFDQRIPARMHQRASHDQQQHRPSDRHLSEKKAMIKRGSITQIPGLKAR